MTTRRRNPDAQGIDWDRDDFVIRDITPGRIAVFENVDGQITIQQGNNVVYVGSGDLGQLISQLHRLAYELGYKPPPSLPEKPFSLLPFRPGNGNGK